MKYNLKVSFIFLAILLVQGLFGKGKVSIDPHLQTIVTEEMRASISNTSPKWANAIIMDVSTGTIVASFSSDSVERLNEYLDYGSLTLPLQILSSLESGCIQPTSTATIRKKGIILGRFRYYDSLPRDTTLDIPGIISTSSKVAAATMLYRNCIVSNDYIFNEWGTMYSIMRSYCKIADNINQKQNNPNLDVIQKGLHEVVWNNELGTASVRTWRGQVVALKAQSDKIHIAGKTGATLLNDSTHRHPTHRLSFLGYFPEEAPKYCCLVVIDSPTNYPFYDAGYDCGGAVRRIAERIYKY